MKHVLEDKPFYDNAATFVADLNKARLANRKQWLVYVGTVAGASVEIKTYDTGYLQIFRVNGLQVPAGMDMKVGAWRSTIQTAIERQAV
jgi:hypothetical protein